MFNVRDQSGFAAIEAVLIVAVVAIVGGTGYYVYHANKKTNDTLNDASKVAQSSPDKVSHKKKGQDQNSSKKSASATVYLTIKQWGVRAPVSGGDTLTYKLVSSDFAQIISKKLADDYGCTDRGAGGISRNKGTDPASKVYPLASSGEDIAQYAQSNPGKYGKVGAYYYFFAHEQAACGSIKIGPIGNPGAGEQAQSAANNYTESLVTKLQAAP